MSNIITSFNDFDISPQLKASIVKAGFTVPTPIQAQAIPPGLEGRDIIGAAQTGTGKTAAFVVPIVERLRGRKGLGCLILTPTRELALQIEDVFHQLARGQLRVTNIIGGASMGCQRQALRSELNVIIATPGRLLDHMGQATVDLRPLKILVLDEADRMLDMGFKPQIDRILAAVPKQRQTMLFSATIPEEIAAMSRAELHDPVRVEISRRGVTAEKIDQGVFHIPQLQKIALLFWLLEQQPGPTLVFTRTKHRADRVARTLQQRGFTVATLHANRSLNQRKAALEGFKRGTFRVLVATDIAARGIDVIDIAHVVNFDLPHVPDDYVHRVGRTARAERSGHAWSFVAHEEARQLRDIERLLRKPIPVVPLPAGLPQPAPRPAFPSRHQPHPGMRHPQPQFRPAQPRGAPPYRREDRGRGWAPPRASRTDWTPPDTGDVFFIEKRPMRRAQPFGGGQRGGSRGGPRGFHRGGGGFRPHRGGPRRPR
ncbi:DEAD/DEAH box helicase [Candidatus Uhrbacteria bacterium]|nr:DEAD/DEAH box helicase [Candidatus Uhrbacteria bacterium]